MYCVYSCMHACMRGGDTVVDVAPKIYSHNKCCCGLKIPPPHFEEKRSQAAPVVFYGVVLVHVFHKNDHEKKKTQLLQAAASFIYFSCFFDNLQRSRRNTRFEAQDSGGCLASLCKRFFSLSFCFVRFVFYLLFPLREGATSINEQPKR